MMQAIRAAQSPVIGAAIAAILSTQALPAPPANLPSAPPESTRSSAAIFHHAVKRLTEEARDSWQRKELLRPAANFAADFDEPMPAELLSQKLTRRLHEHPFVDAYIRWQLTSFPAAAIPTDLNDRLFDGLIRDLPAFLENPRADRNTVNALVRTVDAGELTQPQQKRAARQLEELTTNADRIAALNAPAREFRSWVATQTAASRHRSLLIAIEHVVALVDSGWPSDQAKQELDARLLAATDDESLTSDQRNNLLAQLPAIAGRQRVYIANAAIRDNRMWAQYADTAILDFEVRQWARRIEEPPPDWMAE